MSLITLDMVRNTIASAEAHERNHDVLHACHAYEYALRDLLSIAVTDYQSPAIGIRFLGEQGIDKYISKFLEWLSLAITAVQDKTISPSMLSGNYPYICYAHLGLLLGNHSFAQQMVDVSLMPFVVADSSKLWTAYTYCLGEFIKGQQFDIPEMKLRGAEKDELVYLNLMRAILKGESVSHIVDQSKKQFEKRQHNMRASDPYLIEGSAISPVQWDFRLESILLYCNNRQADVAPS